MDARRRDREHGARRTASSTPARSRLSPAPPPPRSASSSWATSRARPRPQSCRTIRPCSPRPTERQPTRRAAPPRASAGTAITGAARRSRWRRCRGPAVGCETRAMVAVGGGRGDLGLAWASLRAVLAVREGGGARPRRALDVAQGAACRAWSPQPGRRRQRREDAGHEARAGREVSGPASWASSATSTGPGSTRNLDQFLALARPWSSRVSCSRSWRWTAALVRDVAQERLGERGGRWRWSARRSRLRRRWRSRPGSERAARWLARDVAQELQELGLRSLGPHGRHAHRRPLRPGYPGHMSAQAQAILEQALRLSADERAHLADALQRSLEDGASGLPPDEVTRLWNDEIKRRLARARDRVVRGEPLGRSADEIYADGEARIQAIRARRGR